MRKYEELSNSEVSEVMAIIDDEEFDYDHVYKAIIEIASRAKKRINKLSYLERTDDVRTAVNFLIAKQYEIIDAVNLLMEERE